ncbi:MAG: LamG-like jellyroll fold domain-containing protein [Roseibacillus sp.]
MTDSQFGQKALLFRNSRLVVGFLLLTSGLLLAQDPPAISDYHILDSSEPALVGQLDSGDRFGRDFNPLGDLDLDGVPDFLVGARSDDDGATDAGALYVLFMNADGSVKNFTKISDTSGGLTAAGISLSESQLFGYAVTTVGDLDGDSVQDIAVGARRSGPTADGGAIYILFLNRDGTVKSAQTISNSSGNLGHTLASSDFFGEGAIGLGTIDGVPTLAVANSYNDDGGNNRGALYILQLNADGTAVSGQTVKISSTSGGLGAGVSNGDRFGGRDVVPLGDIDGDGNLDIAVSAFQSDGGRGSIWVLRLNADFTVKARQKIGEGVGGLMATLNEDGNFGHAAVGPGDLDGDGVPDLITSANKSAVGGTNTGEVYYLFLNPDGTVKSEIRLSETSGILPFTLPDGGRYGRTLANLGDLRNDGTQCLAVGGGAGSTGEVFLHFIEPASELLLSDPRAIPSNVLWLDGSDVDGDFTTGGSFLSGTQWVDKSSAANAHASQSSATQRPSVSTNTLNGLSVVSFDGDDLMDVDSASFGMMRNTAGATVIAVARPTSTPAQGGHRVFMASTGTSSASSRTGFNFFDSFGTGIGGTGDAGLAGRRLDSDPYQRINGGSSDLSTYSIWVGEFDYADGIARLYQDGALETEATGFQSVGNTSDTDSLNIRLGADASLTHQRGFFTGDLAELIVYDRVLHPSERKLLEDYLAAKWGPPQLCVTGGGSEVKLTWPVSPVPWRLESSSDLTSAFTPTSSASNQVGNQQELTEVTAETQKFYQLVRP